MHRMTQATPIADNVPVHGDVVVSAGDHPVVTPSLDASVLTHLELSVDPTDVPLQSDNSYQVGVHHGCHASRRTIVQALSGDLYRDPPTGPLDVTDPRTRLLNKIADCCRSPILFASADATNLFVHQSRCKSRVCPRCGRIRIVQLRDRLLEDVKLLDDPRFLTLTLVASDDPLQAQVDHLIASFRRLRQQRRWKIKSDRGWYFVEITYNRRTDRWHPHLHVVVDGKYYRQDMLSRDWEIASRGSTIVDIRRISKRSSIAHYVTDYVTKSQSPANVPGHKLVEWSMTIRGLRMVQPFGRRIDRPLDHDTSEDVGPAQQIVPMMTLVHHRNLGDDRARRLVRTVIATTQVDATCLDPDASIRHTKHIQQLIDRIRRWTLVAGTKTPQFDRGIGDNKGTTRDRRDKDMDITLWGVPPPEDVVIDYTRYD